MVEIDACAPIMHAEHDFLIRTAQNTFPRAPISSKNHICRKMHLIHRKNDLRDGSGVIFL